MHESVAQKLIIKLQPPLSSEKLADAVSDFIAKVADDLNLKGIIPGHIKVLIAENDVYAAFSCTKPGKIIKQTSASWDLAALHEPSFSYNIVIFGIPKEKVINTVKLHLGQLNLGALSSA
ncbi:MAG: hypothetical protein AB1420_17255 [Bacillota bacterium]